jgi:surfactin synthase thioesterase subunit
VSFLTGRQDPLTAWQTVAAVAREAGIDATVVPGGHFLPLEHPDLVREQITEMAARTGVS